MPGERTKTVSSHRVVYTAIFGDYDSLTPLPEGCGCDLEFVCFTDNPGLQSSGWRIVADDLDASSAPALKNRHYKILAHEHLRDYEQSLYVDGHITLRKCPCRLFDRYLDTALIAVPYHKDRDCIYEEAEYVLSDGKVPHDVVSAQMDFYRAEGFPAHFGLTENGILLRRHREERVIAAMQMWWREYSQRARRDQISLPYVLWKSGLEAVAIAEGPRVSAEYFKIRPHKAHPQGLVKRIVWEVITSRHRGPAYKYLARFFTYLSDLKNAR